jgi:hypothetical protein
LQRHIVVAFRMPPAGMTPGPEGGYLARARSMCSRGEALGGRLVAWSAGVLAIAFDDDSVEEAVTLAANVGELAPSAERAWSGGIAEGELEPLAPDGQRMHLAWGEALLAATGLARVARAGEVLVDGDVRALRAGQLALIGARSSTDAGRRVRGWRLDLNHPWKRGSAEGDWVDAANRAIAASVAPGGLEDRSSARFIEEVSTAQVLEIIEAAAPLSREPSDKVGDSRPPGPTLADRVRALSIRDKGSDPVVALTDLRKARGQLAEGPAASRCQVSLALAMALSIAGRPEEALLDALDALACARETKEPKAVSACIALLSRLYANAGFPDAATKLLVDAGG